MRKSTVCKPIKTSKRKQTTSKHAMDAKNTKLIKEKWWIQAHSIE